MTERITVRLSDADLEHLETVRRTGLSPSEAVRLALQLSADILTSVWTPGAVPVGHVPDILAVTVDTSDTEADIRAA